MTASRPDVVRARRTAPRAAPRGARRGAGLLTACGALLVSGLQAAPDARAEPSEARWGTDIVVRSGNGHSSSCTVEGEGNSFDEGEMGGGDTVSRALNAAYSVANPDDVTDTQALTVDSASQWRLGDVGGTFRTLRFSMDTAIAGTTALDESDCSTTVEVESVLGGTGEVPSAGFLELSLDTSDAMTAELAVVQPGTAGARVAGGPESVKFRGGSTSTARTFVEAGEFFYNAYAEIVMDLPEGSGGGLVVILRRSALDRDVTGSVSAAVTYVKAGSASRQRGPGGRFVRLQARTCANDQVKAAFTPRAGKLKRAVFSVDGARKKTVRKPKAGRSVVIGRLGASDDVTVSATLTLKNGATRTVSRSYVACSG